MTRERIREIYRRRGPDAAMEAARASQEPELIEEVERLKNPDMGYLMPEQTTGATKTKPIRHQPIAYGMSVSELDRLAAARKAVT